MQGAKQMHIKRRCDCELPRQSCRLGRACVDLFYSGPALVLFGTPAKKEVRREVGFVICDARVEVHPINWLIPEVRNPPRHSHISPTPVAEILVLPSVIGIRANQGKFYARHLVNNCCAGV